MQEPSWVTDKGPELLLRVLRGEEVDWEAIEENTHAAALLNGLRVSAVQGRVCAVAV